MTYVRMDNLPLANLPRPISEGVAAFKTEHEQGVFLYGSIAVLSSLFTGVWGVYRQQRLFPNQFLLVVAPAASGKSVLKYAGKLVSKIHQEYTTASLADLREYKRQLRSGSSPGGDRMAKPPFKTVLIPANCTAAKLYEHLVDNEGIVPNVIVESELDTLTVANTSEFGNFSDLLRKTCHNEPIAYSRKTGSEFMELNTPKLALAIAGTPNQVPQFIDNAEDGLLSRFLVYSFDAAPEWSSVAPCDACVDLDEVFEPLADLVYTCYQNIKDQEMEVSLSIAQWKKLDQFGEDMLFEAMKSHPVAASSIVKRHAMMAYKICMTLTALRAAERNILLPRATCTDEDFEIALALATLSLKNSLQLFSSVPRWNRAGSTIKRAFFEKLKVEFTRAEAITTASELGISARTCDRWLNYFTQNGDLIHTGHGPYKKLK